MDEPEQPPLPPLAIGDLAAAPAASPDALREILRRHRRRQTAATAVGLAVVLVAGALGGWAVGNSGKSSPGGVQVAAGTPSGTTGSSGSPAADAPVQALGTSGGGSFSAGGAGGPSTQVLVRDASDGTRVRLYTGAFPVPTFKCPTGASCPQPALACTPDSMVSAEVSDDQVAGTAGGLLWSTTLSDPLDVVTAEVVGAAQPQPILVVVGRTSGATAKVTLTTTSGTDSEAPTNGWVALAVRLPAGFTADPSTGLPSATVAAFDVGGTTLSSTPLATAGKQPPCSAPCAVTGKAVVPPPLTTDTSSTVVAPGAPVGGAPALAPVCTSTCVQPMNGSTGPQGIVQQCQVSRSVDSGTGVVSAGVAGGGGGSAASTSTP